MTTQKISIRNKINLWAYSNKPLELFRIIKAGDLILNRRAEVSGLVLAVGKASLAYPETITTIERVIPGVIAQYTYYHKAKLRIRHDFSVSEGDLRYNNFSKMIQEASA